MFFFFFQAEDGIRDKLVTGVQTCALPIFHERDVRLLVVVDAMVECVFLAEVGLGQGLLTLGHRLPHREGHRTHVTSGAERSEERRVGKECRARWSPYP